MIKNFLFFITVFIFTFSSFVSMGAETVIRFDADDYESPSLWDSLDDNKVTEAESTEQSKPSDKESINELESESELETQNSTQQEENETSEIPSVWEAISGPKEKTKIESKTQTESNIRL